MAATASTMPSFRASCGGYLFAFQHQGQGGFHADHAGQALRAAATGQQAELHLGQADFGFGVIERDAVVAGQAYLVAAPQHGAVDGRHEGLALGFHAAKEAVEAHGYFQHVAGVFVLIAQDHFEVRPGDKLRFGGGDDDAFYLRIRQRLSPKQPQTQAGRYR